MSRLEEIKEHFRWTLNNSLVPRLHDSEIEWLIQQAERVEAIIKHRNDISKANEYLNEQNQRYKQALEEIKNFTLVQDTDSVVEIKGIAEEALTYYLMLGENLNFTAEEVEQAYLEKNKVNYERQETGY